MNILAFEINLILNLRVVFELSIIYKKKNNNKIGTTKNTTSLETQPSNKF